MTSIVIALELYKQDYFGELPDGSSWSDSLVDTYTTARELTFISKGKIQWNYALNENVTELQETPDDIIVVFESVPGWNLVGGKELLVGDNDKDGCWFIFGNMDLKYVLPEDLDSLRWE